MDKNKLSKALFRQLRRFEDVGLQTLGHRRTFLITLFTITLAFLAGFFTIDLEISLNIKSVVGIFIMSFNIFLIPLYFWYVLTMETGKLKERYNLLLDKYNSGIYTSTQEELNKFKKLFKIEENRNSFWYKLTGIDIIFHFIVWSFIVGMAVLIFSLKGQILIMLSRLV